MPSSAQPQARCESPKTDLVQRLHKVKAALNADYALLSTRDTKGRLGKNGGWRAVGAKYGISGRTAHRIAHGHIPRDKQTLVAIGLAGRRKKTFEQNATDYDTWLATNASKINAIVQWAETL